MQAPNDGKQWVLIVPDGAADLDRMAGLSPLAEARTPWLDFVAREGRSGRMRTLYPDLPPGSIVAILGMLGWEPHRWHPDGRASCELLALDGVSLAPGDLAFRANLVRMDGSRLASYNAGYIESERSRLLLDKVRRATDGAFPDFDLFHNSDFRNCLVVRRAGVRPHELSCPEPHEHQGQEFDLANLISGSTPAGRALAGRLNEYLAAVARALDGEEANMLFPWSASRHFTLPPFREVAGVDGPAAIVGAMDFLHGIAKAGGIDFHHVGNGRPRTDYAGKGRKVLELLASGHQLVVCHVNGPDEAAHEGDRDLKIFCIEEIDTHIVGPVVEHFLARPHELGGVMVVPDHYTNFAVARGGNHRAQAHSIDPSPFAVWDGLHRDSTTRFDEDAAAAGCFGREPVDHLDLLQVLGVARRAALAVS